MERKSKTRSFSNLSDSFCISCDICRSCFAFLILRLTPQGPKKPNIPYGRTTILALSMVSLEAVAPSPILGLTLQKGSYRAKIALMAEEKSLLLPFRPKLYGVGKGTDGLPVATNKRTAKVDVFEFMLLALEVGDLTDVVADGIQQAPADIFGLEGLVWAICSIDLLAIFVRQAPEMLSVAFGLPFHFENFAETAGNRAALQPDLSVVSAVDISNEHVNRSVVTSLGHAKHLGERCSARKER